MVMAPVGILAILMSPMVGKHAAEGRCRASSPPWHSPSSRWCSACAPQFTPDVDFVTLMMPTMIQGAAMAMFFIPLTSIILSGLPPDKLPAASGLSNFVRIMFGGIGTSISTTLWDSRSTLHHAQLAEHTGPDNPVFGQAVHALTAQGMPEPTAWAVLERTLSVQASTLAAADIFWLSAILFLMLIGLVWLTHPLKTALPPDAAGAH